MNDHIFNLLAGLRPADAERVGEIFPAQRRLEMLAAIVGEAPLACSVPETGASARRLRGHGRRPRRLAVRWRGPLVLGSIGAAAAAIAAILVLGTGSAVSPAPADAVAFHRIPSGEIVARVTEPFAAQARLNAAFAKQGLDITVQLIPVSPSIVGTLLYVTGSSSSSTEIEPLQGGHCLMGGGGCAIGVKIPRGYIGSGGIALGRPAKPGEEYESSASAFAPGEPLHCSGLLGAKVQSALPVIDRDKLTAQWSEEVNDGGGSSRSINDSEPPLQNYIWGAMMVASGHLSVTTHATPWPDDPGAGSLFNKGC